MIPEYGGNLANIADDPRPGRRSTSPISATAMLCGICSRGQDFLFNLAAQTSHLDSMTTPEDDLAINCTAQLQLLEACRAVNPGIAIVHAGTRQIYGRPRLPAGRRDAIRCARSTSTASTRWPARPITCCIHDVYGIKTPLAAADQCLRPADAHQGCASDLSRHLAAPRARGRALRGLGRRAAARSALCRRCRRGVSLRRGDTGDRGLALNVGGDAPVSLGELWPKR